MQDHVQHGSADTAAHAAAPVLLSLPAALASVAPIGWTQMSAEHDLHQQTADITDRMKAKLGIRARDFPAAIRKARHRWPKPVHRHAVLLADALPHADHPRLARTLDRAALARSARIVTDHLDGIDPSERRKDLVLGILASIAFGLIVTFAAVVFVLVRRGLI